MPKIAFWNDDSKRKVDPKLFSEKAESLAKVLNKDHEATRNKANKRTQIRKFYDEVLRLQAQGQAQADKWDAILPQVHMITAKAAYALGRELVSENFVVFIRESVDQIQNPQDLTVFANFFEAFMGFYRLHGPRA
jgi:CRISPR-associated protein Csm2